MFPNLGFLVLAVLLVEVACKLETPEEQLEKEEAKLRAKEAKKYNKYEAGESQSAVCKLHTIYSFPHLCVFKSRT